MKLLSAASLCLVSALFHQPAIDSCAVYRSSICPPDAPSPGRGRSRLDTPLVGVCLRAAVNVPMATFDGEIDCLSDGSKYCLGQDAAIGHSLDIRCVFICGNEQ